MAAASASVISSRRCAISAGTPWAFIAGSSGSSFRAASAATSSRAPDSSIAAKRASIRDILCEEGRRGQKTGAGFYDYDDARNAKPSADVEGIIRDFAKSKGIEQRKIGDAEILERCIYPMINEGAKILEEGKAQRASDIDIVWINGYGWPVYRGGPMFYADTIGLKTVLAKLREFQAKFGDDFKPAALLEKLAAESGTFTKT